MVEGGSNLSSFISSVLLSKKSTLVDCMAKGTEDLMFLVSVEVTQVPVIDDPD